MNSNLLNKYLRNECNPAELEEVLQWFRQEADSISGKKIMEESWNAYQEELPGVDFESMLDRLHHQINLQQTGTMKKSGPPLRALVVRYLVRAAAILFLPAMVLLLLTYGRGSLLFTADSVDEWVAISTPAGSKTNFNLPDGSVVWLNHGSTLRYPPRFKPGTREVELAGEGYFEVKSDLENPFRVYSGELEVIATGTEFNVLAYPEDTTLEITLVSGSVDIRQEVRGVSRTLYQMEPDEHLIFQKQARKLIPTEVSIEKYIGWKEGKLIFEKDPIDEVTKRLSRWFNVDIELADPSLSNIVDYTGTFESETLPQILDLMELATPIESEITPRALQPDGSYNKMKVVIRRK